MAPRRTEESFTISLSKWKVWPLVLFLWAFALLPLFIIALFGHGIMIGEYSFAETRQILWPCIILILFLGGLPLPVLLMSRRPLAILTSDGISGYKFLTPRNLTWTPQTFIYYVKANLVIVNPDTSQSRRSRLWKGPNNAILVHSTLSTVKREDVLKAIERLSPYPIKETTLWALSKRDMGNETDAGNWPSYKI